MSLSKFFRSESWPKDPLLLSEMLVAETCRLNLSAAGVLACGETSKRGTLPLSECCERQKSGIWILATRPFIVFLPLLSKSSCVNFSVKREGDPIVSLPDSFNIFYEIFVGVLNLSDGKLRSFLEYYESLLCEGRRFKSWFMRFRSCIF